MLEFAQSTPALWVQLLITAGLILFASNFLAKSADVIALRTGLGRSFIGVVLLATATSLPELGTGVSAITLVDAPDLAVGDAYGSNLFNLFIIGILDLFWRGKGTPILNSVSTTSVTVGALGIVTISITIIAVLFHESIPMGALAGWFISPITIILLAFFLFSMYMIYRVALSDGHSEASEIEEEDYASESLLRAGLTYLIAAVVIIGSAIWLARTGEGIAHAMHWEASFVGTQFLAFSTSLPELAASIAALRINAPELAISNVLGSNLFNMGFILTIDDLALVGKPLWSSISSIHEATAIFAIIMTSVVILGLMVRNRSRPFKFVTYESMALIALYIIASLYVFSFAT
ncbi:MAG: sodium:calcium antiporter [Chloroflexi bacterium]|nr:sodium:calcium antiporter [Chloroflexota bacterium]